MGTNRARRTSRRILSLFALSALAAGMLGTLAPMASAVTCQATDGIASSSNLQTIIDGASTGDTITVKGTCVGNFSIPGAGSATSLTLVGKRLASTLDGNGSGSVLAVGPGTTVTLKRLRITNGNAFQGGGINNNGGTVNLKGGVRVIDNTATGDGGGIFNTAPGYLNLSRTARVDGNSAAGYGGGIYNNFGAITMTGKAHVNSNTASIVGGGIYNDGGALVGATPGVNVASNNPNNISP